MGTFFVKVNAEPGHTSFEIALTVDSMHATSCRRSAALSGASVPRAEMALRRQALDCTWGGLAGLRGCCHAPPATAAPVVEAARRAGAADGCARRTALADFADVLTAFG